MTSREKVEMSTTTKSASPSRHAYSTLSLLAGNYPFLLSEHEQLPTDQWAWRFLRLNPYYRYDYNLRLQKRPGILSRYNRPGDETRAQIARKKEFLNLDSRYFLFKGEVASAPLSWPSIKRITIEEYLTNQGLSDGDIDTRFLSLRRLESVEYYGISYWFDPALVELPRLEKNQSWFFYEKIVPWNVGDRRIVVPERQTVLFGPPRMAQSIDREEAYARAKGDHESIEDSFVRKTLLDILENSKKHWDGFYITVGEQGGVRRTGRDIAHERELAGEELTPVQKRALTFERGFFGETEIAFLIDLNKRLRSQIAYVTHIAKSFQELHQSEGLSKKLPVPPLGFQPLAFHPDRVTGSAAGLLCGASPSMSLGRKVRSNLRLVILDVRFSLPVQIRQIEQQLDQEQKELDKILEEQGKQPLLSRKKTGRAVEGGDHWLKRALTLTELHINLAEKNSGKCLSPEKLCRAVYDTSDETFYPLLREESISSNNKGTKDRTNDVLLNRDEAAKQSETIKGALRVGRNLVLGEYLFLLGG